MFMKITSASHFEQRVSQHSQWSPPELPHSSRVAKQQLACYAPFHPAQLSARNYPGTYNEALTPQTKYVQVTK